MSETSSNTAGEGVEKVKATTAAVGEPTVENYTARDPALVALVTAVADEADAAERLAARERAAETVLSCGGIRANMSVPPRFDPDRSSGGFKTLKERYKDTTTNPVTTKGQIEGLFLSREQQTKRIVRLDDAMSERGVRELVDIRYVTKWVQVPVPVEQKSAGFLGALGFKKQPTPQYENREQGVLHSDIVDGGAEELAIRITYYIPPGGSSWEDFSGRPGQTIIVEMVLPASLTAEILEVIDADPGAMRHIVQRVMKEKMLSADPGAWETPQGRGPALRPPYETWDASSAAGAGSIYIQKDGMTPGFHTEALRKI